MCWSRDRFHGQSPSTNQLQQTSVDDSHPEPASDRVLTPSSTRISSPLAYMHPPIATATCVRVMDQDYHFRCLRFKVVIHRVVCVHSDDLKS